MRFTPIISGLYDLNNLTWYFGDGNYGTTPNHLYGQAGVYTVILKIGTPVEPVFVTKTNYITITRPVSANFTATPLTGFAPLTVAFKDSSTGDNVAWQWSFGSTSPAPPDQVYSQTGSYPVGLTVRGAGGDSSTLTQIVRVLEPCLTPVFTVSPTAGQAPFMATFTNQANNGCLNGRLDFGDGQWANFPPHSIVSHQYQKYGTYQATSTMEDAVGKEYVHTEKIAVAEIVCPAFSINIKSDQYPNNPRKGDSLKLVYSVPKCEVKRQRQGEELITWYRDGVDDPALKNSLVVSSNFTFKTGEVWTATVKPCERTAAGLLCDEAIASSPVYIDKPLNRKPVASNVVISPTTPLDVDNLTLTYTFSDINEDTGQPELSGDTQIFWYRNDNLQIPYNNKLTILAADTTSGDKWCARVIPRDNDQLEGEAVDSLCVVIGTDNYPPQVLSPTLTWRYQITGQNMAPTTAEISVTYTYRDKETPFEQGREIRWFRMSDKVPDRDNPNRELTWNHQPGLNDQQVIKADVTLDGELWQAEVRVYDGQQWSAPAPTAPIKIIGLNTPPICSRVKIVGTYLSKSNRLVRDGDPTDDDDLLVKDECFDPDGDDFTTVITWYQNITSVVTGIVISETQSRLVTKTVPITSYNNWRTIPASETQPGLNWYVRLTPKDSRGGVGLSVESNSVLIQPAEQDNDTPPSVGDISIVPAGPTTADSLQLNFKLYDVDSQEDEQGATAQIRWTVSNVAKSKFNDLTNIPQAEVENLESNKNWCAVITPIDKHGQWGTPSAAKCVTVKEPDQPTDPTPTPIPPMAFDPIIKSASSPDALGTIPDKDNLVLRYEYSDANCTTKKSECNNSQITWYAGGIPQSDYNGQTAVPSSVTFPGQVWTATVKPCSKLGICGEEVTASPVTINHPPVITGEVAIIPMPAVPNQVVTITCHPTDADNDPVNKQIEWQRNGILQTKYNEESYDGQTEDADTLTVICTPHDGLESGQAVSTTTRIRLKTVYLPLLLKPIPPTPTPTTTPQPPTYTPTLTPIPTNTPVPTNTPTPTPTPLVPPHCRPETGYEQNNRRVDACPLEFGQEIVAYPNDEDDVYYFVLNESTSVKIHIDNYVSNRRQTGFLRIYDSYNNITTIAADNNLQGTSELRLKNLYPGDKYYVRVHTRPGTFNTNQPYHLTIIRE